MKVWKDLVERYFNYYPETKSMTDGRTDELTSMIPIYPRLSSSYIFSDLIHFIIGRPAVKTDNDNGVILTTNDNNKYYSDITWRNIHNL
jgi:hypothetical protein